MDTSFLGKKVSFENDIYTVYEVDQRGVFAHSGNSKFTNENGIILNAIFLKYELAQEKLFKPGRPSMGKTKKVSITLTEDDWEYIDRVLMLNEFSYSQYFRMLVENDVKLTEHIKSEFEDMEEMLPKITFYNFDEFDIAEEEKLEGGWQKNARVSISVPERDSKFTVTFYMVDDGDFSYYTDYEFHNLDKRINYKEYHKIIKNFIQYHGAKLSNDIYAGK